MNIRVQPGKLISAVISGSGIIFPLFFASYSIYSSGWGVDYLGLLDSLVYILAFFIIYEILSMSRNSLVRGLSTGSFLLINILLFWGSVLYQRHFHAYPLPEVFTQWGQAGLAARGMPQLVRSADLAAFIAMPAMFFLAGLGRKVNTGFVRQVLPIPVLIVLALSVHWSQNNYYTFANFQVNPIINMPRHAVTNMLKADMIEDVNASKGSLYNNDGLYIPMGNNKYPFLKTPAQNIVPLIKWNEMKPNIILIVLESFQASESGAYNYGRKSFTPQLDTIASRSLMFRNIYSNGFTTRAGEFSILSSFYPRFSLETVYGKLPDLNIQTLPSILQENGYDTTWISGLAADATGKAEFHIKHGLQKHFDDPPLRVGRVGIGSSDEDIYSYALDVFDQLKEPFFAEIMTLSAHTDFFHTFPEHLNIPTANGDDRYKEYTAGYFYADYALGQFINTIEERPYFDNTIFVITSDHGATVISSKQDTNSIIVEESRTRIPFVIFAPTIVSPDVIETPGAQIDITPTLLDMLGIHIPNSFAGSSLLRSSPSNTERMIIAGTTEGQSSIRIGNKYCYNRRPRSYHKDQIPSSGDSIHVCFSYNGDILNMDSTKDLLPLSKADTVKLLDRNAIMKQLALHLMESDLVWPGENNKGNSH